MQDTTTKFQRYMRALFADGGASGYFRNWPIASMLLEPRKWANENRTLYLILESTASSAKPRRSAGWPSSGTHFRCAAAPLADAKRRRTLAPSQSPSIISQRRRRRRRAAPAPVRPAAENVIVYTALPPVRNWSAHALESECKRKRGRVKRARGCIERANSLGLQWKVDRSVIDRESAVYSEEIADMVIRCASERGKAPDYFLIAEPPVRAVVSDGENAASCV